MKKSHFAYFGAAVRGEIQFPPQRVSTPLPDRGGEGDNSPALFLAGARDPEPAGSPVVPPAPLAASGGSHLGDAPLEIAQLLSLFELHRGFVPGFEFEAEGFSIPDLVARGLITKSQNHLDGGCYLIGEQLAAGVHGGGQGV